MPRAKAAAEKALALDDTLSEAHSALGHIRHIERDWAGAERAFKRALEIDPNSGVAHAYYAYYLRTMRRFDEAVNESKRAVELEPTSVLYNRDVAMMLYFRAGTTRRLSKVKRHSNWMRTCRQHIAGSQCLMSRKGFMSKRSRRS